MLFALWLSSPEVGVSAAQHAKPIFLRRLEASAVAKCGFACPGTKSGDNRSRKREEEELEGKVIEAFHAQTHSQLLMLVGGKCINA
jgi:hypothetical protein